MTSSSTASQDREFLYCLSFCTSSSRKQWIFILTLTEHCLRGVGSTDTQFHCPPHLTSHSSDSKSSSGGGSGVVEKKGLPELWRGTLTQLGRQLVSVTVAVLVANRTSSVQHLNEQNSQSPQSWGLVVPSVILLPPPLSIHPQKHSAFSLG